MLNIFEFSGIIGLVLITAGVVTKKRIFEDILYIFGGIFLEIYSLHLGNLIFILLQAIFTIAAAYDYFRSKR